MSTSFLSSSPPEVEHTHHLPNKRRRNSYTAISLVIISHFLVPKAFQACVSFYYTLDALSPRLRRFLQNPLNAKNEMHVRVQMLCLAQGSSAVRDGGLGRPHFSLLNRAGHLCIYLPRLDKKEIEQSPYHIHYTFQHCRFKARYKKPRSVISFLEAEAAGEK